MMRFLPILCLSAATGHEPAAERLQVIATISDLGSLARTIGGDAVEVVVLVQPGQDPHSVIAKPSQLLKLSRADVLIEMGLNYEHAFLPALLEKCRNDKLLPGGPGFVNVSAGITPLEVPASADRGQGADIHPQGNPHFNLDPDNARIMARAVADVLKRADADRAEQYERNFQAWDELARRRIAEWDTILQPFRGARIVTYHRSWSYFAARYGLEVVGTVEPKPGLAPSAGHLRDLANRMREQGVKLIVMEPWYSEGTVGALLEATGARVLKLYATSGGTPQTAEYLAYMDDLVRKMAAALGG